MVMKNIYGLIKILLLLVPFLGNAEADNKGYTYNEVTINGKYGVVVNSAKNPSEENAAYYEVLDKEALNFFIDAIKNGHNDDLPVMVCKVKSFLALRDAPSKKGRLITKIQPWETMKLIRKKQQKNYDWVYVRYQGEEGWVYREYVCDVAAG